MWKLIRIWALFSWSFLTIGILLGSWWAYHELGWGGWWFWDPVENASLMPWLLATACIHSITKPKLNNWTIICAQATFLLSILGTFFVRSGLLSSVHSFATDSTRGLYLLAFLFLITSISFLNWVLFYFKIPRKHWSLWFGKSLHFTKSASLNRQVQNRFNETGKPASAINDQETFFFKKGEERKIFTSWFTKKSRNQKHLILTSQDVYPAKMERWHKNFLLSKNSLEQILLLQNFYLCVICLVVLCGTSAPFFFQWIWNRDVGTGAPFYHGTLIPLFTSVFFVLLYSHYIQLNNIPNRNLLSWTPANEEGRLVKSIILKDLHEKGLSSKRALGKELVLNLDKKRLNNNLLIYKTLTSVSRIATKAFYYLFTFKSLSSIVHSIQAYLDGFSTRFMVYVFLYFFFHLMVASQFIKLNLLNSIYCAICFLMISSIIISISNKSRFSKSLWPVLTSVSSMPNRHILLIRSFDDQKMNMKINSNLSSVYRFDFVTFNQQNKKNKTTSRVTLRALGPRGPQAPQRSEASLRTLLGRFLSKSSQINEYLSPNSYRNSILKERSFINNPPRALSGPTDPKSVTSHYATSKGVNENFNLNPKENLFEIPNSKIEMNIAHTGIVLFILGIFLSNTFKFEWTEQLHSAPLGIRLGSQVCCLRSIDHSFAPTFHSICANLLVFEQNNIHWERCFFYTKDSIDINFELPRLKQDVDEDSLVSKSSAFLGSIDTFTKSEAVEKNFFSPLGVICMFPEKRFYYSNQGSIATKVAIHSNLFTDFYSFIGTGSFETGWFTTIMKLPFIFCIWLGFMFGVIGGLLSLKKQLKKSKLYWL